MRIFLGFGKNRRMMEKTKSFLSELEHDVVLLEEEADNSLTVIEKLEQNSSVDAAIFICSGDDEIRPYRSSKKNKYPRQNVVFEIGYFAAKLGRKNVLIIVDKSERMNLLSDFNVCYVKMGASSAWQKRLLKNLEKIQGV